MFVKVVRQYKVGRLDVYKVTMTRTLVVEKPAITHGAYFTTVKLVVIDNILNLRRYRWATIRPNKWPSIRPITPLFVSAKDF